MHSALKESRLRYSLQIGCEVTDGEKTFRMGSDVNGWLSEEMIHLPDIDARERWYQQEEEWSKCGRMKGRKIQKEEENGRGDGEKEGM